MFIDELIRYLKLLELYSMSFAIRSHSTVKPSCQHNHSMCSIASLNRCAWNCHKQHEVQSQHASTTLRLRSSQRHTKSNCEASTSHTAHTIHINHANCVTTFNDDNAQELAYSVDEAKGQGLNSSQYRGSAAQAA